LARADHLGFWRAVIVSADQGRVKGTAAAALPGEANHLEKHGASPLFL
jgi:hypothetical protein